MCTAVMNESTDKSPIPKERNLKLKKKEVKFKKAPGAPRRFKSAFIFFSTEKHKEIRTSLGKEGSKEKTTNVAKMVSEAWKSLPPEEREYWEEMARVDKERYEMEKSFYDGPWKIPAEKLSKDPRAPKRPMSAFLAYSNNKRSEVKQTNPSLSNAEVSRMLASMWKEVNNEEKQRYIDEEMKLREEYKLRIAEWRANEEIEIDFERKKREEITLRTMESHKQQLTAAATAVNNTTTNDGVRLFPAESSSNYFPPPHGTSHQGNYVQDLAASDQYYGDSNNTVNEPNMSFAYDPYPPHYQHLYHQAPYHYPMPYHPRMEAPYGGAHFRSGNSFHSDPSPYNHSYYNHETSYNPLEHPMPGQPAMTHNSNATSFTNPSSYNNPSRVSSNTFSNQMIYNRGPIEYQTSMNSDDGKENDSSSFLDSSISF